jgi:hypothetical protein
MALFMPRKTHEIHPCTKEQGILSQKDDKIKRCKLKITELESKHVGNETSIYNYHAGWQLGYYQGMLTVLEDLLDEEEIKIEWDESNRLTRESMINSLRGK